MTASLPAVKMVELVKTVSIPTHVYVQKNILEIIVNLVRTQNFSLCDLEELQFPFCNVNIVLNSFAPRFFSQLEKCMKSADVLLMVDGSASITTPHFRKVRRFLKELVSRFNVSTDGTHVGLLQFSSPWYTKIEFDLDRYKNVSGIKKHISTMKYQRGKTYLGDALRRARVQVVCVF